MLLHAVAEEAVQKQGGYLNFQDTFVWRNLHSYEGLVKSGGAPAPYSATYGYMFTYTNGEWCLTGMRKPAQKRLTTLIF